MNKSFDDERFEKMLVNSHRTVNRSVAIVFILWVFWGLFCLLLTAGLIYVAIHFITKYW